MSQGFVNVQTYTVLPPTIQTFTSGSGTYTTPAGVKYITVRMCGGGGGGRGTNGTGQTDGGAGGNTTFGTSFLTANGGAGGIAGNSGGAGGTATGGDINVTGGAGSASNAASQVSAIGGCNPFGGAGPTAVGAGQPGDGYGAGGSAGAYTSFNATAGGAGGYLEKLISSPAATYSYAVGAAGTAGGGSVWPGGAGKAGIIIITEYYQ